MPDIDHTFGGDLTVSANGDLLTVDSVTLSQEMVLRRLLTNPRDYIWHPDYGAGLPAMVGKPVDVAKTKGIILAQMFLEVSVVQDPAPVIDLVPITNGLFVHIKYTEVDSGQSTILSFSVNG